MKEYFFKEKGIYYRKNEFDNNKKTLVFVHGVSGSSSAWLPYEKKFQDRYNVLSFDLRGHGKSEKPLGYQSYKIELLADDIFSLLQKLNISKCIIISHSFGSVIVLSFLSKYQNLVEKVVLLSPQYDVSRMLAAKIAKPFIFGFSKLLPNTKSNKPTKHIDYSKYLNSGDWNIPRTIADVTNTGIRVYLYCAMQTYLFNGERILEKINTPTLIIHGRKDSIFPIRYAIEINHKIKDSKMAIIENSDHILVLNNFAEVSELIEQFIKNS